MQNAQVTTSIQIAGLTFSGQSTRTGDAATALTPALPAGFAGALTTRSDGTGGVVTLEDSGHGLTDQDTVDVYWSDGSARGGSISGVNGAEVTIAGLTGDDLPLGEDPAARSYWRYLWRRMSRMSGCQAVVQRTH
jgi:hypothetical protein